MALADFATPSKMISLFLGREPNFSAFSTSAPEKIREYGIAMAL
jgi:hypothetical protein